MKLLEIDFAKKKKKPLPTAIIMPFHELPPVPRPQPPKGKKKHEHLTLSI